jgi:Carboxypeptidase regulatory-like domain
VKARTWMQLAIAALAFGMFNTGPAGTLVPQAAAQNLGERTVSGTVLSAASTPVAGATVFLENEKTKSIRSFTSIENGHFQFSQVNKDQDYDLWAEKDGKKSAVKTVSSWDARTDFVSDLKLK